MSTIRDAGEWDFEGILRLFGQLWPERTLVASKMRDVFRRGLASDRQAYLCATDGEAGPVVGFGSITVLNSFSQQGPLANLDELVVDEAWRRRGVGTALLERLIARAAEMGCGRLDLHSQFRRAVAHAFYERRGFERRAYLFTRWIGERP